MCRGWTCLNQRLQLLLQRPVVVGECEPLLSSLSVWLTRAVPSRSSCSPTPASGAGEGRATGPSGERNPTEVVSASGGPNAAGGGDDLCRVPLPARAGRAALAGAGGRRRRATAPGRNCSSQPYRQAGQKRLTFSNDNRALQQ